MTLYGSRIAPRLALSILLVLLSGCAGALSNPETRYYLLDPVDAPADPANARQGPVVGVTPIDLPEYLNQPGITTRGAANEVVRAEFDQWAGPLADEVMRVVGENLSLMLPTDRVTVASGVGSVPLDFLVEIEIGAFEGDQTGAVELIARWTVFRDEDRSLVAMRTSRISRPATATDYNSIVTSMSGALADLCREIASTIAEQPRAAASTGAEEPG